MTRCDVSGPAVGSLPQPNSGVPEFGQFDDLVQVGNIRLGRGGGVGRGVLVATSKNPPLPARAQRAQADLPHKGGGNWSKPPGPGKR
jgi:hypothetical protein